MDQDVINKDQKSRIQHLEKIIEDLVARITKQEDRINVEIASSQRITRATAPQLQITEVATTVRN